MPSRGVPSFGRVGTKIIEHERPHRTGAAAMVAIGRYGRFDHGTHGNALAVTDVMNCMPIFGIQPHAGFPRRQEHVTVDQSAGASDGSGGHRSRGHRSSGEKLVGMVTWPGWQTGDQPPAAIDDHAGGGSKARIRRSLLGRAAEKAAAPFHLQTGLDENGICHARLYDPEDSPRNSTTACGLRDNHRHAMWGKPLRATCQAYPGFAG